MPGLSGAAVPTTGHATYPPSSVVGGSGKVFVDGKPVLSTANATHVPHTNTVEPFDTHAGGFPSGSSKVNIEGAPALRIGDPIDCGDTVAGGSGKTNCA